MLNHETVELLQCPSCRVGELTASCAEERGRLVDGHLTCDSCRAEFPVETGIPHLKADVLENDTTWQTWRNHLDGFAARRSQRSTVLSTPREERWSKKMRAFADFVRVPDGRILDVGCGPGNLRKMLAARRVTYFGLDPLPVEQVDEFPFVCAVAESLPFRAHTFTSLVIRSALNHFLDLDVFFAEAARVLTDDGQIFLEQVVHKSPGVGGFVRNALHSAKDLLDDLRTRKERKSAPKHVREFSQDSLLQATARYFDVSRVETYNANWYTPPQVFIYLQCRDRVLAGCG